MIYSIIAACLLVLMAAFDVSVAVKSGSPTGWFAAASALALAAWQLIEAWRWRGRPL